MFRILAWLSAAWLIPAAFGQQPPPSPQVSNFRWIKDAQGNAVPTTVHVGDAVAVICEASAGYQTGVGPAMDCGWAKDFRLYKDGVLVSSDNPYVDWNNQAWGYAESWSGTPTAPGTWTFTAFSGGSQVATLTITILANTHNLTTSIGGSGTVVPSDGAYSGNQTINATASAGYSLISFSVKQNGGVLFSGGGGTTASYAVNMDGGDVHVAANFTKNQTSVGFSLAGTSKTYDGGPLLVQVVPSDDTAVYAISFPGGLTYTGLTKRNVVNGPTNAGTYTYTITVTGPDSSYVAGNGTSGSVTIAPKPVTFTFGNTTNTYNGSPFAATATASDAGATFASSLAYGPSAGDYIVSANANGNYTGSGSATATVTRKAVTFSFGNLANQYTGGSFTATVAPSDAGATYSSSLGYGPAEGSYTVSASAAGNYTGIGSASASVTSAPPDVSASIDASPATGTAPASATISWSSSNATSVSVSGPGMAPSSANSGSVNVTGLAAGTYTYTITAQGNGGPVSRTASVTVSAAAPTVSASISVSPAATTAPGSTTVTWSSSNATSVSVSGPGMTTSTATTGSASVTGLTAGTYTYTITAQGNGGPVSQTATVTVNAPSSNVTATISSNVTTAIAPGAATITWSSANATSVSVSGPAMTMSTATSGSATVTGLAAGTYTYTITAQGTGGPVSQTATVTINTSGGTSPTGTVLATITASSGTSRGGASNGKVSVTWTSTNATSVSVTGPGLAAQAALNGSAVATGLAPGAYTYTIVAQGQGGPVTRKAYGWVLDSAWGDNGRSMSARFTPYISPWTGGTVTLNGSNSDAGPALVLVRANGGAWIDGFNIFVTDGDSTWFTWNLPPNLGQAGTEYLDYQFNIYFLDAKGGRASADAYEEPAPTPSAQTVTITPTTAVGAPGSTVNFTAGGGATGYVWSGTTASTGNSGQLTIPSNAAVGTQYTVTVYSPGGYAAGNLYAKSSNATATVTVTKSTATLTWPAPAPVVYGTALSATQLNATADTTGSFVYSPASGTVLNVGSQTLGTTFTPSNPTAWYGASSTVTLAVTPATLTATPVNAAREYGAANPPFTVAYSGFVNGDTATTVTTAPTVSTAATASSPVGTYALSASGGIAANYVFAYGAGALTITAKPVTFTFAGDGTQTYDGTAKSVSPAASDPSATVSVSYSGTGGTSYGPTAIAPTAAGTYTVTAMATGNYSGTAATTLTIAKATPAITWLPPAAITYGTALSGTQLNATSNVPGTFVYSAPAGTILGAGTHTLTTTFTPADPANYAATTRSVGLTVNKATLTVTAADQSKVYGTPNPALTVRYAGFVNGESAAALATVPAAATAATASSPVGAYAIGVSGGAAANYIFNYVPGTLTVTKASATVALGSLSATYDGTAKNATATTTPIGLGVAFTYNGGAAAPTVTGNYAVVATIIDPNYQGSATGTLAIAKATPTVTWTSPAALTYGIALGGSQLNATASVPGTFTYTPSAGMVVAAGAQNLSVTFTPTDTTNFETANKSVSLTVNKAPLTVSAANASRTYGAANPSFSATFSGFVNGDSIAAVSGAPSFSTSATTASAVGTYVITPATGTLAATNYTLSSFVNGTLTITKAPLTATADNQARTYGNANPTFTITYSGFVNGDTSSSITPPSISTPATTTSNVGTYPIALSGGSATNYAISLANGILTVNKAALSVSANDQTRAYGAGNPALTFSITGFVNGDTAGVISGAPALATAATPSSTVGTYAITVAVGSLSATNYSFGFSNGTLTVTRAGLTVRANDQTKVYGSSNPTLAYTLSGFVNGDASSVVAGSAAVNTAATGASAVGAYAITPAIGSLTATNYSFGPFVNGTLTVTKAALTVTANSKTRVYGAANPTFDHTITGFVNGDTAAVVSGVPVVSSPATASSAVGTYSITPAIGTLAAANYSFGPFVNGTLSVTKASLTATADNQSRTYGAANPTLTIRYSGFVNGDTAGTITPPAISTTATLSSAVGSYPITLAGGSASNYTLALFNGTLAVTPAALTATADNQSRIYGSANPTLTISYRGFVNGDTSAMIIAPTAAATAATAAAGVGTYPITLAGGTASNYILTLVDGALTILPKPVTFAFGSLSGVYDGAAKTATVTPSDPQATIVSDVTKGPDAGTYSVTATATGNYTGTGTSSLTINRAPVYFTFANTEQVYDGNPKSAAVLPSDSAATYTADLTKGPDAGTYVVSATATGNYHGTGTANLVISPAPQTITLNVGGSSVYVGQPVAFTATGGANAYNWGGTAGATGSSGTVNLTFPSPGQYTVTVFNTASNNYQQSNTVAASVDVLSNHQVNSLTPVASSFKVTDPNSPMNGQTYGRLWQESGWKAYLGRSGVRFAVNAQAWPSVKAIELQSKAPGAEWSQLAVENPVEIVTRVDATFSVMLGETAPDQPLVPLSFQQGSPQTGPWSFRARVQDANGVWSEFSSEVTVDVVLPVVTKTVSGQTVPPAGALGDWFTASAVQNYSIPLWIP